MNNSSTKTLKFPHPCPHCGKENKKNWCYEYTSERGSLYGVCKEEKPPALGWEETGFTDEEGTKKYRLVKEIKAARPKNKRIWNYGDRNGDPLVAVVREDDGEGNRKFYQQHWKGNRLVSGLGGTSREDIPVYNYQAVRRAIETKQPIWVTEGESCADALTAQGLIATTNIGGGGKWRESDTEDLIGATHVILVPDRDKKGIAHMEKVEAGLKREGIPVRWACPKPDSPFWKNAQADGGLDVVDWFTGDGATIDDLKRAVSDRPAWRNEPPPAVETMIGIKVDLSALAAEDSEPLVRLDTRKLYQYIVATFGDRLRFNELSREVELDGEDYDLEKAYLDLAIKHGIKASKQLALDVFMLVARENLYHPVREYLERIEKEAHPISLDDLATRYLGAKNPIYNVFLKKTLIAAVARVFQPGCKVDTALVLQGKTGIRKSTFFRTLAGQWFNDTFKDSSSKDELLTLHRHWILEWGEIEKVFGKRQAADIKPFITTTHDCFREPYGRKTAQFPRQQILVGSTNESQFLVDSTGNRRYWVIPVAVPRIDTDSLARERDSIWAAAVALYRSGHPWHLSEIEEAASAANNERFSASDVWDDVILEYIGDRTEITIREILTHGLGIELAHQSRKEESRVRDCLNRNGWDNHIVGKERRRVWRKEILNSTDERVIVLPKTEDDHPTITPHDHPENSLLERVSDQGDRGDRPDRQFLEKNISENILPVPPAHLPEKSDGSRWCRWQGELYRIVGENWESYTLRRSGETKTRRVSRDECTPVTFQENGHVR
jgi:predicted P-loop ATPase